MRVAVAAVLLTLASASGCGGTDEPIATPSPSASASASPSATPSSTATATATTTTTSPSDPPRTGTTVISADSQFGAMLYDLSGQPIYLFDKETTATAQCYGECAEAWPPVLTEGLPRALKGAEESLLGTTTRKDGAIQVTYAGHPLYFYAHEGKYQVLCHDVVEYGGTWLVVRPDGRPAPA